MKKGLFFALLALTPLFTYSAPDRSNDIYGVWEDYRTGLAIQIKPSNRRGIKVKRIDGRHRSRWIKYDRIGYNHYDDCDGNSIKLTRRGLKWRKGYSLRTFHLEKTYNRGYNNDRYRRNDDYGYESRSRDRNYITSNRLSGSWYCSAHNVDIDIAYYDDGIRVRRYNRQRRGYDDWYTYRKDRNRSNRYYGSDNRYYEVYDDRIIFNDGRRRKKLEFKRRR